MPPLDVLIATRHRAPALKRLLDSLATQDLAPASVVLCDASEDDATRHLAATHPLRPHWLAATTVGAAPQRNQAWTTTSQPWVLVVDDDAELLPGCLTALAQGAQQQPDAGAISATNVDEAYQPPGSLTRRLLRWMEGGRARPSYAGACVGPGWTFLPADDPDTPPLQPLEWAASTCVLYRRDALPNPPFPAFFRGASLGEDLALSLFVRPRARLWQATRARFHHHPAPGDHKSSRFRTARMELVNRHHILTRVLGGQDLRDLIELAVMLFWGWAGSLRSLRQWPSRLPLLAGYLAGLQDLLFSRPTR